MSRGAHLDRVLLAAGEALLNGGVLSETGKHVRRKVSGNCTDPQIRTFWGRPDPGRKRDVVVAVGTQAPMWVDYEVRCRRCVACLRQRAREWRARATRETLAVLRSWFGTITMSPEAHYRMWCRACDRYRKGGWEPLEQTSAEQRFKARCEEFYKELQAWLKRVRKNSGAKLRYLLVAEAHKSGLPHYHILVHEVAGTVTYRDLADAWHLGFTKFNLVGIDHRSKAPAYVCKYISKSGMATVGASLRYGQSRSISIVNNSERDTDPPNNKHF